MNGRTNYGNGGGQGGYRRDGYAPPQQRRPDNGGGRPNRRYSAAAAAPPPQRELTDTELFERAVENFGRAGAVARRGRRRSIEEMMQECDEFTEVNNGRIKTVWLLRLYQRMQMEMRPDYNPRQRSGPSAFVLVKEQFGIEGQPRDVIEQFGALLQKVGLPLG